MDKIILSCNWYFNLSFGYDFLSYFDHHITLLQYLAYYTLMTYTHG